MSKLPVAEETSLNYLFQLILILCVNTASMFIPDLSYGSISLDLLIIVIDDEAILPSFLVN